MNRPIRNIFLVSCFFAAAYALVNIYFIFPSFSHLAIRNARAESIKVAKSLAAVVLDKNSGGLRLPEGFSAEASMLADRYGLEGLKVFSADGTVLYSTRPGEAGGVNTSRYFRGKVAAGEVYTKVVRKGAKTLEGRLVGADVVETYVPIMTPEGFAGAFEIYYDITERSEALSRTVLGSSLVTLALVVCFMIAAVVSVARADRPEARRKEGAGRESPYYYLAVFAAAMFVAEAFIMTLIDRFFPASSKALLDALLLVLFVSPAMYFFMLRPLLLQVAQRRKVEEELRESSRMLEELTQGITEGIMLLSKDCKVLWANRAALDTIGLPPESVIGNSCYRVMHGKDHRCSLPFDPCPLPELARTGRCAVKEHVHFEKDGNRRYVEVRAYPIRDAHGQVDKVVHVCKDVTDRKATEKLMRDRTEQILRQTRQLEKANAELNALFEVSKAISGAMDTNRLFDAILRTVTGLDVFGVESKGAIFLVEENRLVLAAHTGLSEAVVKAHESPMPLGECLCGLAARDGELLVSKNSDRDARHTIHYEGMRAHGHVIVPVKNAGRVLGVLCLYMPPDVRLKEADLDLLFSIGNQIGVAVENTRLYEQAKALSLRDPLTGLPNRRFLGIELERSFTVASRYGKDLSVIMVDLDHFKKYNDEHGHAEGDRLLAELAGVFGRHLREADMAFRYGGEEFLIILPETGLAEAAAVAEKIREAVHAEAGVTASLGVCSYADGMTQEDLLGKADMALYRAKNRGRNRVEIVAQGAGNAPKQAESPLEGKEGPVDP